MKKYENEERKNALADIAKKHSVLIEFITDISDNYSEFAETSLLISYLKNASDQLHKINLHIATGNDKIAVDDTATKNQ